MAITVGLDFGTHQTKICIENSDSPLHKTYEFYEWEDGVYAFPSIIQINKDHTLRFGSIDMKTCLTARKKKYLTKPQEPILPPMPTKPEIRKPRKRIRPNMPVTRIEINGKVKEVPYSELYGIGKIIKDKTEFNIYNQWHKCCDDINEAYNKYYNNWLVLDQLCPNVYPQPEPPILPEEPFLDGYDYEFDHNLVATSEQKKEFIQWKREIELIEKKEDAAQKLYERKIAQYELDLREREIECKRLQDNYKLQLSKYEESLEESPLIFRYFKQATFSAYQWDYEIRAQDLSVLYLAYVIFRLEERFGTDFSIQMGIPASKTTFERIKPYATGCLIQAIRLVEDVFQNDFEKFLQTPYEKLLLSIPKHEYSTDLKIQYGLIILPEAYAALRSLTANSRIPRGMSIMLDMGGGTTDISFFVIEENGEPHIYHFESISKGLNFFLEYEDRQNFKSVDFSKKRELEDIPKKIFDKAYQAYKGNIDSIIKSLTNFLHQDTISRGFQKSAFRDAVQNRPAIYTGGGCYDTRMRRPILDFTDVIYIDKRILDISNIVDEKKVKIPYSLMSTAYGLSIQRVDDEIEVSRKEDLFAKYSNIDETQERWNTHREHGMYED